MDDVLARRYSRAFDDWEQVLILVVMYDALAPYHLAVMGDRAQGLNPCCNG